MHASVNMGCQGKSGPGKIHEVILVTNGVEFQFSQVGLFYAFRVICLGNKTYPFHKSSRRMTLLS